MSSRTVDIIQTQKAPGAIGPYNQAVIAGDTMYISGQLPLTPQGEPIFDAIDRAAEQALSNLCSILASAGGRWQFTQVRIYLRSMADYPVVNAVYEKLIPAPFPARAVVEVAGLPKDAPLEVEATAVRTG